MDVACAGILVADVFASPVPQLPGAGELITTSGFITSVGGCAANVAVALRILGREATVAGKIGIDMFGDFVINDLLRHGVGVDHIKRTSSQPTSATVILTVEGEDRRYLHATGANAEFTVDDIDRSLLDAVRILYVGGYLAMPGLREDQLAGLFREARRRRVTTVLDVVMPSGVSFSLEHIAAVLANTDYFLPNEDEARRLTGQTAVRAQAECLSRLNPDCSVVITRGSHGALTRRGDLVIETPPFPMKTVDESGAGDAFAAGLIVGLLENWSLERALSFAAAVGASCTRELGCSGGVFTFDQALACLDGQATKVAGTER